MICTKCKGGRVIFRQHTQSTETVTSCLQCGGSGFEPEQGTYYVIWFNRENLRLELHASYCIHDLFTKPDRFQNIGADRGDLQEAMRSLHEQHKPYAVLIEDCLR